MVGDTVHATRHDIAPNTVPEKLLTVSFQVLSSYLRYPLALVTNCQEIQKHDYESLLADVLVSQKWSGVPSRLPQGNIGSCSE